MVSFFRLATQERFLVTSGLSQREMNSSVLTTWSPPACELPLTQPSPHGLNLDHLLHRTVLNPLTSTRNDLSHCEQNTSLTTA